MGFLNGVVGCHMRQRVVEMGREGLGVYEHDRGRGAPGSEQIIIDPLTVVLLRSEQLPGHKVPTSARKCRGGDLSDLQEVCMVMRRGFVRNTRWVSFSSFGRRKFGLKLESGDQLQDHTRESD